MLEDSIEGNGMKGRFFVKDLHIHDYGSYDYDEKDDQKTFANFRAGGPAATYYGMQACKLIQLDTELIMIQGTIRMR